jgi:hypothetical protein
MQSQILLRVTRNRHGGKRDEPHHTFRSSRVLLEPARVGASAMTIEVGHVYRGIFAGDPQNLLVTRIMRSTSECVIYYRASNFRSRFLIRWLGTPSSDSASSFANRIVEARVHYKDPLVSVPRILLKYPDYSDASGKNEREQETDGFHARTSDKEA